MLLVVAIDHGVGEGSPSGAKCALSPHSPVKDSIRALDDLRREGFALLQSERVKLAGAKVLACMEIKP
jgi:hypothetical protein